MRHLKHEKNCPYCGKHFTATRIDAKFCSGSCKEAYRRKNKINTPALPATTYDYDKHFSLLPKEVQRAIHPGPDDFCPECHIGGGAHTYGCSHQDDEIKKGTGGQVLSEVEYADKLWIEQKVKELIRLLNAEVERRKAAK
jgi:predicted nucleic acid-binding Zn ribbon protein